MIQRIQSLYLLLILLFSVILLSSNILTFSGAGNEIIQLGFRDITGKGSNINELTRLYLKIFIILGIILAVLSLISVFLYSNRKLQGKMVLAAVINAVLLCVIQLIMVINFIGNGDYRLIPGPGIILPLLMVILAVLARRGIRRDERLVSSYERLR